TVVVQNDGTFTFPLIGRIKASEMTVADLEKKITTLLARGYVRNPQVMVVIYEARSKSVFVVGEVARPGTYPLVGSKSLVEILGKAGPMTSNAGYEVIVVRPTEGAGAAPIVPTDLTSISSQADVMRINIRDIQTGDLRKNIALRANDTVFVPPAVRIYVSGEVRNPGGFAFQPGTTARQAISLAGGFTDRAASGRIRVVRAVDGKAREIKIRIDDPIEPGDTVIIKEKLF
ncbi:MAG: SLBB domain-containing protein, partial [Vicinamibacteria bacterium]|nr:SLBB domain-containing protein [Vicinamibacteria bacterium]